MLVGPLRWEPAWLSPCGMLLIVSTGSLNHRDREPSTFVECHSSEEILFPNASSFKYEKIPPSSNESMMTAPDAKEDSAVDIISVPTSGQKN